MTSRRSRLKVVANLPVRRKPPTSQETSDEINSIDNFTTEKLISDSSKESDSGNSQNKNSQAHMPQEYIPTDGVVNANQNLQGTAITCNGEGTNIGKINFGDAKKLANVVDKSCNGEVIENSIAITGKYNLNNNKYSASHYERHNLILSSSKEKNQEEVVDKSDNFVGISKNNGNDNATEDVNCVLLNSENVSEYFNSTYTPCVSEAASNNLSTRANNAEFEEAQVYNELVKPTEIFITSPAFNNKKSNGISEGNQISVDSEPSEPIFTTLNSFNVKEVDKVNFNCIQSNTLLNSGSQDSFIKSTVRNCDIVNKCNSLENTQVPRISNIFMKEKPVKENLVNLLSQSAASNPEFLNLAVKQSISVPKKKRSKRSDYTKKLADARREFQKKYEKTKPDRSTLKMIDLIFYNPSTNPMESKNKNEKKGPCLIKEGLNQEILAEEEIDEPESIDIPSQVNSFDEKDTENLSQMPVPQVKIGLNGEIILDERSLVIETTEAKRGREDLQNSVPVFEDRDFKVSYYRGKTRKTRDWTDFETKRFYIALNIIGPDFSLMQKYFPKRSRLELKNKFKREERLNRNLIDKALNNPSEFDMTQLEKDLAVERKAEEELEMRLNRRVKEKPSPKKPRRKSSRLSREMVESDEECEKHQSKLNFEIANMLEQERNKKKKEISFIFKKIVLKESEKLTNELTEISQSSSDVMRPTSHGVL